MDLVDEEKRALAGDAALLGGVEHLAQVRHTREHRRERLEMHGRSVGQEARDRGLAAAGRAPEDHRGKPMLRHHAADRPVGPEQMVLAHHLRQAMGSQPIGERAGGLVFEEAHQPRTVTDITWPPRLIERAQDVLEPPTICLSAATVGIDFELMLTMMSPFWRPRRWA